MKATVVAVVAAVLLILNINSAHAAFNTGWNFIRVYNCLGFQSGGVDYLAIYPTTGGVLLTADSTTITAIAPLCASGNGFYIYWTGSTWTAVSIYPSIK